MKKTKRLPDFTSVILKGLLLAKLLTISQIIKGAIYVPAVTRIPVVCCTGKLFLYSNLPIRMK